MEEVLAHSGNGLIVCYWQQEASKKTSQCITLTIVGTPRRAVRSNEAAECMDMSLAIKTAKGIWF